MATSSRTLTAADLIDGTLGLLVGGGIVTMALFPLAIPLLALTAVALIPLLLIPLAAGLVAAPFLLLRRLFRTAAHTVNNEKQAAKDGPRRGRGLQAHPCSS
jgi:hypothetical protein